MASIPDSKMTKDVQESVEDYDNDEKRATHDRFAEFEEVKGLIDSLKDIWNDMRRSEIACERFTYIVDEYQEQPHLIDPYLEDLLLRLLAIARSSTSPKPLSQEAFKYMYLLTKMRGFKVVIRLLPHEVVDMEPVLALIDNQDPSDVESWQTRYVLLIWLSIVCMIPFDLCRLDSNLCTGDGPAKRPVMERILSISKLYLGVNDKCRDAAAYLLSRFLTRPDVKREHLPQMIDWNLKVMVTSDVATMEGGSSIIGSLQALSLIFKHGKREDLLIYAPVVLSILTKCNFMEQNNSLMRKMTTKLIQRLGLIFLKNRIATWRYQRGNRSLASNLGTLSSKPTVTTNSTPSEIQEDEEDFEIPEETEEVIGKLLCSLKDKDTIVRWSAAKGLGRVTGRLPKELADEVVGSVLELFSYQETDGAWHGGCLTLAELGRRGLLLPQRLKDVVPVVLKALLYDERKGNYSVGSHVRDAACYVCWAFARAYEPKEVSLYVKQIANALVIGSLFDREVNVRRAAAAAFQENVGRQGTFPHGIDILTNVDYFSVGTRSHCYLDLSIFIAQFEDYTLSLIDHLVQVKIGHWDNAIRVLTSKALHKLTAMAPEYMSKKVLLYLLPSTSGIDLFQRHGAIIAVAEITNALFIYYQKEKKPVHLVLDEAIFTGLHDIARKLHTAKLFRGHGGELMRKAVCCLIEKLSASKLPFHSDPIIDLWQEMLEECLAYSEAEVQASAVSAIHALCSEYYIQTDGTPLPDKQEMIITNYLAQLKSPQESARMGYSLALGYLPLFMLEGRLCQVLGGLLAASYMREKEEKMAEARRDAIKALARICKTVGVKADGDPAFVLCRQNISDIYTTLFAALADYTMDSRGDIGSWVREASMLTIGELSDMVVNVDPNLLEADIVKNVFCGLIQQNCEKIDRTRSVAGQVFSQLLHHRPELPHIPHCAELLSVFPQNVMKNMNWALPSETFAHFAQLLSLTTYTRSVLLGLTVSVGGLTESLVKHSSASLLAYLKGLKENEAGIVTFIQVFIDIFKQYQKVDRVSLPLLKTLDQLLGHQCFDGVSSDLKNNLAEELLDLVRQEIVRSTDPNKLMAAADVFCSMLQFSGKICSRALVQVMVLLCHKYPRVRKTTANKLYEALLTYDDAAPPDSVTDIMSILSETKWDESIDDLRPVRNNLCDLFGVPKPVFKKKTVD